LPLILRIRRIGDFNGARGSDDRRADHRYQPAQPSGTLAALRARFTATLLDEIEPIPCEIEYDLTNAKKRAHEIIGYVESHFAQAKQSPRRLPRPRPDQGFEKCV
jgi:hypothetical protein